MNGPPGVSIFNDGVSINLNRSDRQDALEEEELQQDQKRLQEELANDVKQAFDDVICDDNDTLNSFSHRYSDEDDDDDTAGRSDKRPPPPPVVMSTNPLLNPTDQGQMGPTHDYGGGAARELRLLLESKSRELEHVMRELYEQRHKHEQQVGELEKRLLIEQAEKDRACMTRDQTRQLLVQSKTKISEAEDTNDKLRGKVSSLEDQNVKLVAELEQKNMMLQDTQHRYRMLEQNTAQKADRHTDALLKQTEERHNAKMAMMQQQIDNLRSELDERQQECRRLEARYSELQKSREAMLIEQSETVQRLQDQLEDSQRQCSNLLSKSKTQGDFGEQERQRMRSRIHTLEQEQSGLKQTIHDLTDRLEKTNAELDLMDSLVHGQDEEDPAGGGSVINQADPNTTGHYTFAQRNLIGSTPNNNNVALLRDRAAGGDGPNCDNRVVRLKNELRVCMAGQKEKRDLIRQLEANLQSKDRELEQLKRDESDTLVQMNQYKEEAFRLASKCRILEQELEKLTGDASSTRKDSDRSITAGSRRRSSGTDDHRQEAAFLEDKIFGLQQAKLEADDRVAALERENKQLSARCETLSSEAGSCAALKLEVEKQKFLLQDAQKECERLKRLYIEVSGAKEELGRELSTLRSQDSAKQIAVLQEQVVSLERALQLAELKASELGKLLDKEKTNHEELLKQVTAGGSTGSSTNDGKAPPSSGSASCTKCIDALTQISKLEIENLKLQSSCSSQLREIAELKVQLNEQAATVTELHKRLDLKAERDQLLDELKEKAAQFEQIIRNQISTNTSSTTGDNASSSSPPQRREVCSRDQSVGPDDPIEEDSETRRRQMRELEQKVREEMAKVYAGKVNQIEEKFVAQFNRFKENIDTLKHELYDRVAELKVRNQEVEVLKCAIVTERDKMGELLAQKDTDARSLFDKQSELMGKYKAELANGQKRVQFLERELQEKRELVASERQSMEKLIAQITAERKMFREREQEMNDRFKEVELEYRKSLDLVTEKYQSAKKTALNYKKYAEDKEQHMLKEYDRIKEGYNVALQKVQTRMKEALEGKEQSMRDRIAKLEADYETKLQLIRQKS